LKKFLKNRTLVGVVCIMFALILSFGITPILSKSMSSQTEIIRARENIKEGEKITKEKIIKVKVGGYNLPNKVIKEGDEVVGKYAKQDVLKGDYFFPEKIGDVSGGVNPYLNDLGDKMAVSVTIKNFAAGLSAKLKEGDIVTILSANEDDKIVVSIPELKYVKVLAVTDKKGVDKQEGDIGKEDEELPATVTLLVSEPQAKKLVECEQNGNIHIALAYRGVESQKFLDTQEKYLQFQKEGGNITDENTNTNEEDTQDTQDTQISDETLKRAREGQ